MFTPIANKINATFVTPMSKCGTYLVCCRCKHAFTSHFPHTQTCASPIFLPVTHILKTFRFEYECEFHYEYEFLETFRFEYECEFHYEYDFLAFELVMMFARSSIFLVVNRRTELNK